MHDLGFPFPPQIQVPNMKIDVNCADGTDEHCDGTVKIELPFTGLSKNDVIVKSGMKKGREVVKSVRITPPAKDWVKENDQHLSELDIEAINKYGRFDIQAGDLEPAVCDACGSSER